MSSIMDFLGALASRTGAVLVLFALFLFQVARLDLLHAPTITFLSVLAAWLVLALCVVTRTMHLAAVGASLYLGFITLSGMLPGVANGAREAVLSADSAAQRSAQQLRVPRRLACDRDSVERITFFTGPADARVPMVWYSEQPDGRFDCWDRSGVHPRSGEALDPVTPEVVALIGYQEPERAPVPAPAPPSPAPQRTVGFQPVEIR